MFDYQILVKMPVTRFTAPAVKADAAHGGVLLNGAYYTFIVCNTTGFNDVRDNLQAAVTRQRRSKGSPGPRVEVQIGDTQVLGHRIASSGLN